MIGLALSPKFWGGLALGLCLGGAFAVLFHGPARYRAGGIEKAAELDAATTQAAREIKDAADRHEFLLEQCRSRGGVWNFGAGRCLERPAD